MGLAFGQMFKSELTEQLDLFYDYYLGQLKEMLINKQIPEFLVAGATSGAKGLLNRVLDLNVMITKKYTNPRYYEEIKGIGAGARIPPSHVSRLNIFPELIKAACTVAGVWKTASLNTETLHLRALDWDAANPINKYPLLTVYHPKQGM